MVNKHLITGIKGQDGLFLSSHILDKSGKNEIIGISRNTNDDLFIKKLKSINKNVLIENIQILNIDIQDKYTVNKLISDYKPNFIYNLSGPSSVYKSLVDENRTRKTINTIFENIIDSVVINSLHCNVFQASSSEMFDKSNKPLNEKSKFKPRSSYAEAKLQIHESIQHLKGNEFLNISSGIMFNHESEFRDKEYLVMKIINAASSIKNGKTDTLTIGSLDLIRDWSYAKDVAEAIYKINNEDNSEDYVIGSGQGNSIKYIIETVFNYFGLSWREFVREDQALLRVGDPKSIISDPSKINKRLEWKATVLLEEVLIKCIESKKFH